MNRGWSHPLYNRWRAMIHRCHLPSWINFENYGGRGIKVCDRWRSSFWNFLEDMGPTYKQGLWLERIDNDGNYEPSNCCWKTPREQRRNARNTRLLTFAGKTQPTEAWAEELGVKSRLLRVRLWRGWSVGETLSILDLSNNNAKRKL